MDNAVIPIPQVPAQKILKYEGSEVADVRVIVDCGAASIKPDYAFLQGMEFFIRVAERVVQSEHDSSPE
jgi:hypothetical protein